MLIRRAKGADIPCMRALEQQAETAAHWAERDYYALFVPEAPRRLALLATETEEIKGFVVARCDLDEWEIENVVVATEHRRVGVGTLLIRELLYEAEKAGATSVVLEVRDSNDPARRLYEKLGFKEVGRRPKYYENPAEDALLLKISVLVP